MLIFNKQSLNIRNITEKLIYFINVQFFNIKDVYEICL